MIFYSLAPVAMQKTCRIFHPVTCLDFGDLNDYEWFLTHERDWDHIYDEVDVLFAPYDKPEWDEDDVIPESKYRPHHF